MGNRGKHHESHDEQNIKQKQTSQRNLGEVRKKKRILIVSYALPRIGAQIPYDSLRGPNTHSHDTPVH